MSTACELHKVTTGCRGSHGSVGRSGR
jgi:hypothetical protein